MKASYHNGRTTKAGNVYNANHNTKIETREKQKHIDHERTLENVVWARDINNLSSRKPCLGKCLAYITKVMGKGYARRIMYANPACVIDDEMIRN